MPSKGPTRRLAAILSAAAVAYSRLMAADESATVETIVRYRELIAGLVNGHGGRVVDSHETSIRSERAYGIESETTAQS